MLLGKFESGIMLQLSQRKDNTRITSYNVCYTKLLRGFMLAFLPVSNLIFPVGTFMNERFMFMPSFFYCTAIVVLFIPAFAKMSSKYSSKVISILIVLVFIGYSAKSITRNRAWKNDFTLFTTDVLTSANSAKSNCSAGGKLWEAAKIEKNESTRKKYYSLAET